MIKNYEISSKDANRRVVMDLSFPHGHSVNNSIPSDSYLGDYFKLRLPDIDQLVEFILEKGCNCHILKKDLHRGYWQFPVDPKDYNFLGFCYEDFYGAEHLSFAAHAFSQLGQLLPHLGKDSSPEKNSPPSKSMSCLGILVDTAAFTLEVPPDRLDDLLKEQPGKNFFHHKTASVAFGEAFLRKCVC